MVSKMLELATMTPEEINRRLFQFRDELTSLVESVEQFDTSLLNLKATGTMKDIAASGTAAAAVRAGCERARKLLAGT